MEHKNERLISAWLPDVFCKKIDTYINTYNKQTAGVEKMTIRRLVYEALVKKIGGK